jgi:hypothetical protein
LTIRITPAAVSSRLRPNAAAIGSNAAAANEAMGALIRDELAAQRALQLQVLDLEQQRWHAAAARTFGTIQGANPRRSEQVRQAVRARLAKRHAR